MIHRWLVPILVLAGLSAMPAQAAEVGSKAFLSHSLQQLSKKKGFQCSFAQNITYADGSSQGYGGQLDVARPGRFRWHYDTPYEQLYVGDGKVIWHYEPDLMQAERMTSLDAVDPVVMRILDGKVGPKDVDFLGYEGREGDIGRYHVRLGESEFWLGIDSESRLAYIESIDALGNRNRISLTGCIFIAPEAKHFSFVPPSGVDVIDVRQAAGQSQ